MKQMTILIIAISLLFGCAIPRPISESSRKVGAEPSLGATAVASVGDVIYAEYDMYIMSQSGVRLLRGYRGSRALAEISLEEATFLAAHENDEYCSVDRIVRDIVVGKPHIVCFSDEAGVGAFTKMRVPALAYGMWTNIEPPPYRKEVRTIMGRPGESGENFSIRAWKVIRFESSIGNTRMISLVQRSFSKSVTR